MKKVFILMMSAILVLGLGVFAVSAEEDTFKAMMLITGDTLELFAYVNGEFVYEDMSVGWWWEEMVEIELKRNEDNIIAIHGFKDGWPAAIMAAILVHEDVGLVDPNSTGVRWVTYRHEDEEGRIVENRFFVLLTTGELNEWKTYDTYVKGWEQLDFDDSNWWTAVGHLGYLHPPWSWGYAKFDGTGAKWTWNDWSDWAPYDCFLRKVFNPTERVQQILAGETEID